MSLQPKIHTGLPHLIFRSDRGLAASLSLTLSRGICEAGCRAHSEAGAGMPRGERSETEDER